MVPRTQGPDGIWLNNPSGPGKTSTRRLGPVTKWHLASSIQGQSPQNLLGWMEEKQQHLKHPTGPKVYPLVQSQMPPDPAGSGTTYVVQAIISGSGGIWLLASSNQQRSARKFLDSVEETPQIVEHPTGPKVYLLVVPQTAPDPPGPAPCTWCQVLLG